MLIDKALERVGLDNGAKFVLYLCQYANPDTKIFSRTYKQIQNDLGISQVTIAKYFQTLEDSGLIIRSGNGRWRIPAVIGKSESCDGPEWYVESKKYSGRS